MEADFGTSFYSGFPKSTRGSDFENLNWDFASDLPWQFSKLSSLRKKSDFFGLFALLFAPGTNKNARSWFSLPRGNEKTNFVIFVSAWGQQFLGATCMLICNFPLTCSSLFGFLFHLICSWVFYYFICISNTFLGCPLHFCLWYHLKGEGWENN